MRRLLVLLIVIFILWQVSTLRAEGDQSSVTTEGPYFLVLNSEEGIEQFPLKQSDVEVKITGVIAEVTIRQHYSNQGQHPISGRYIFPGSTRAAVHGMTMTVGERVTHAVIKEKQKAKDIFNKAKNEGKNASLLEQKRPNVFSMDTANIMPGQTIIIELYYTELLVPEDGTYEFVFPTVVGPRYVGNSEGQGSSDTSWVKNPYLFQGSKGSMRFNITTFLTAGMELQEVQCLTHDTRIHYKDNSRAKIELADPEVFSGDRDYILHFRLADKEIETGLLLGSNGEENYFLLMAQPPEHVAVEHIVPREYLFVVDVSGSMHGFPLDTAKQLLRDLLGSLQDGDYFNVVLFAGSSEVMSETPIPASPGTIGRAISMIENVKGGGGTELYGAVKKSLALQQAEGVSRSVILITDGYISAEREVFELIQQNLNRTNVFAFGIGSSVNRFLIEGVARSGAGEPYIVTDSRKAAAVAQTFRKYISSPVMTDISVSWEGVDIYDVEPPQVPDLFSERPVILFGKWRGEQSGNIHLTGKSGEGEFARTYQLDDLTVEKEAHGLVALWARSRLSRLTAASSPSALTKQRDQILELGLSYNLLTPFTSFVAVDEIVVNPEKASQLIKQPLNLPKGVSNLAVGGSMHKVPEPGLTVITVLMILTLFRRQLLQAVRVFRRRDTWTRNK